MEAIINTPTNTAQKPTSVRTIFILNALKILISFGFYTVFALTDARVGNVGAETILYTSLGYIIIFPAIVLSILKRSLWGLRISLALDFIISLPARAFIGLAISTVSMIMTFRKTAQTYFEEQQ